MPNSSVLFPPRSAGAVVRSADYNALQDMLGTLGRGFWFAHQPPSVSGRTIVSAAVGDGVTNDTAAIQAAIDAAAVEGGGCVWLGNGDYSIAGIDVDHRVALTGCSAEGTRLVLRTNSNRSVIKVKKSGDGIARNAQNVTVMHLSIWGNKTNQSAAGYVCHGIEMESNPLWDKATQDVHYDQKHRVVNVNIYETKGDGFYHRGRSMVVLIAVQAIRCARYGFNLSADTSLVSCAAGESGSHGFYINDVDSINFSGCKSYWSGETLPHPNGDFAGCGFYIAYAASITMASCEAQDNRGAGLFLTGCDCIDVQIHTDSNSTEGQYYWPGVDITNCRDCTVIGSSTDRFTTYKLPTPTQMHALRIRNWGGNTADYCRGVYVRMGHKATRTSTVGAALMSGSTGVVSQEPTDAPNEIKLRNKAYTANT